MPDDVGAKYEVCYNYKRVRIDKLTLAVFLVVMAALWGCGRIGFGLVLVDNEMDSHDSSSESSDSALDANYQDNVDTDGGTSGPDAGSGGTTAGIGGNETSPDSSAIDSQAGETDSATDSGILDSQVDTTTPIVDEDSSIASSDAEDAISIEDSATDAEADTATDSATDATVDPCLGDTDSDDDGICDAVDLELQPTISANILPVVSIDGQYLFTVRSDFGRIETYNISTSELAAAPAYINELSAPSGETIRLATTLADGRLAVSSGPESSMDLDRIQVYSFDGTSFSLQEEITTTSNRVYDIVYDSNTDRLYWADYDEQQSVHYYVLGSTPIGYNGLGTPFGTYSEQGTYGLLIDEGYLYRLKDEVDVVDLSNENVIQSVSTDGSHVTPGHGNVAKYDQYVLYVDKWFTPINLTAVDVSTPDQASQVASFVLSNTTTPVETSFAVRAYADVAIVADSASGLHVIDLSTLPSSLSEIALLDSSDLQGLIPAGAVDCNAYCCYADTTDGSLMVLCP